VKRPVSAETDVGEEGNPGEVDEEGHVRARPHGRGPRAHPGRERRDREPDPLEHGKEEGVLLEAVASTTALDQLGLERPSWSKIGRPSRMSRFSKAIAPT
jgi:hypothetical protein